MKTIPLWSCVKEKSTNSFVRVLVPSPAWVPQLEIVIVAWSLPLDGRKWLKTDRAFSHAAGNGEVMVSGNRFCVPC